MGRSKIFYDMELWNTSTKKKSKVLYTDLRGPELRKARKEMRQKHFLTPAREIRVYKKYEKKGENVRDLYDTISLTPDKELADILRGPWKYTIDVEYDYAYDCQNYGCGDEGICRCSTIENAKITDIPVGYIIEKFIKRFWKLFDGCNFKASKEILNYCIDRMLRHAGLSIADNWDLDIRHSYYGEEIFGIYFSGSNILVKQIGKLLTLNNIQAIKYVLTYEYGYLTDEIKNGSFCKVREINKERLIIPNKEYLRRLDKDLIKEYENYSLPIGVYQGLRLVDGYHRHQAVQGNKVKIISIS